MVNSVEYMVHFEINEIVVNYVVELTIIMTVN